MRRPMAPPILPPAGPATSNKPSFSAGGRDRNRPPVPAPPAPATGHSGGHPGTSEPNFAARKAKKRAANAGGYGGPVTAGDQANAIKKIPKLRGKVGME